jgi:Dolichyl-phosphate-mannose-protein mannosyltransferase
LRRTSLVVLCGWLAFLTALALWIGTTENPVLRDQLRRSQFWFLEALFALLVGLTVLHIPALVRSLALTRADYLAPIGAAVLAAALAGAVAPGTNRIYYDEQIYQGIGQNMSDLRLAQMCNDGTLEYGVLQCWRGEYNKQPYGYPYLLSLVYRVGGVHYWTAVSMNVLCAALFAALAFVLSFQLFEDRTAARASAMVAALIPQQLLWSHTAAAEPSAAVTGLLAVVTAMHFVRTRSTPALLWTVLATAFALQFRVESALVALVVALAILLWTPSELGRSRLWGAALLGAMLSAGLLAHLIAVRNEGWGASGDRFSMEFLASNFRTNGAFYISDWRFPAIYTLLALCAVVLCRRRREAALLVVYFAVFFAIYLFFYAGSYNYGADIRYSLMTFPPLAVLAGAGAAALIRLTERRLTVPRVRIEAVAALLLAFQFLWYLPLVRAVGEEAWAARADIDFSQAVLERLPRNSIVLTHNPSVFHVMGRNAAQLSLAANEPQYVRDVLIPRYAGGVYLHWNFWCNVADKVQREFCESARGQFSATLFSEHRERDYRYALYRLSVQSATH